VRVMHHWTVAAGPGCLLLAGCTPLSPRLT
jgi:hypothetical protein